MVKAKRAHKVETLKQTSCYLKLRAPHFYPDKNNRRKYPSEEIVSILRQHLLENVLVSDLCDKYGFHPTMFYRWQKQFFENGAAAFDQSGNGHKDSQVKKLERQNAHLQAKLTHKDEVIAEIMESHIQLKKKIGQD